MKKHVEQPNLRESATAALMRLYPLKSGNGVIVASRVLRMLAGVREADLWGNVVGGRIFVPIGDHVGRSAFFMGDLDPKLSWAIDRYVRPGDVAADIGANLGLVTLRLAARVGPTGRVHSFEPSPTVLRYLQKTLKANPDLPVTLHPVALGREETSLLLSVPANNAGQGSLVHNRAASTPTFEVKVRPLSAIVAEHEIDRLDFVKIDVEGFEAEVLEGSRDVLAAKRPRAVLIEENLSLAQGLTPALQILSDLGYRLFGLPRRLLKVQTVPIEAMKTLKAHDFVALSPDVAP